ncbi:MAG: RND family transporter [Gemmatimonadota bacterium]
MLRIPHKCHLLYKYNRLILLGAFAVTLVGGFFTSKLRVDSDLAELLPSDAESVRALDRLKEEVGGIGQLRIVLETRDFEAARRFARDLEPALLGSSYVGYVDYENDVGFYRRNALLFLDTLELDSLRAAVQSTIDGAKRRLNPLLVDDLFGDGEGEEEDAELKKWEEEYRSAEPKPFYTNADSTVLVLKVFSSQTSSDLSFDRAMAADVRRIVAAAHGPRYAPDLQVYYGGSIQNRIDEYETVKQDIVGTAVYGFGGVFLLIVLYFRQLVGAGLITVSLLASLSWTFGLTYLVIGRLNTITGFLFVILFGLGIDYGIHAFARYVESRRAGMTAEQAIDKMVCQTGTALGTTAVTTAAAFFSLLLMEFKGFSDLGFIAGVGMLFAFLAMVMVLPALLVLAEDLGWLRIGAREEKDRRWLGSALRRSRPILLLAFTATAVSAFLFSRVGFDYDFTNLRAITRQRELVGEKTRGVFSRSESPAVVVGDSPGDVAEIVAAARSIMRADTLSPTIESVRSVFSLVPRDQGRRLEKIRAIRELVEEEATDVVEGESKRRIEELRSYLAVDRPFTWEEFPERDKREFLTRAGTVGNLVFIYPSLPLRDGRNAMAFRDDVGTIATRSGKVFHAASSNIIAADMLTVMTREGALSGVLAFAIVFLLVLADFRSLKAAALVLAPLAIGVVWMGGAMHAVGMKLNFFNIVVLPSIVGIGVDSGVHIYHRYLEEGSGSLPIVLRNTGLAIAMTTLTTIVGYSGLILARHPGLRSIGRLAVIGLLATFVAAVVLLPAILQLLERRQVRERAEAVLPGAPVERGTAP